MKFNSFRNLAQAEKRATYIAARERWWDRFVPYVLYVYWVHKTPWVDNYCWLTQKLDTVDYFEDLGIQDMWAGAINRWCDNNRVDTAPYCVRRSCKDFLDKRIGIYEKLR